MASNDFKNTTRHEKHDGTSETLDSSCCLQLLLQQANLFLDLFIGSLFGYQKPRSFELVQDIRDPNHTQPLRLVRVDFLRFESMYHMPNGVFTDRTFAWNSAKFDRGLVELRVHSSAGISFLPNMKACVRFGFWHDVEKVVELVWHADCDCPRQTDFSGLGIMNDKVDCWLVVIYYLRALAGQQVCKAGCKAANFERGGSRGCLIIACCGFVGSTQLGLLEVLAFA